MTSYCHNKSCKEAPCLLETDTGARHPGRSPECPSQRHFSDLAATAKGRIMNARQKRGKALAASAKIEQVDGVFLVPSASGMGLYSVKLSSLPSCTCLDHLSH